MGDIQTKRVAVFPGQFRERGSAPQAHPQAVGQGPYVGTGTASHPESHIRQVHPLNLGVRNTYALHLGRNILSGPGQLVERLTLVFGGGIGGNGLLPHFQPGVHLAADGRFERQPGPRRPVGTGRMERGFRDDRALNIPRIRG